MYATAHFIIEDDTLVQFAGSGKIITVPKNVKSISGGVFRCHRTMTNIYLPEGLNYVGAAAFERCRKLTDVCFPEGVFIHSYQLFLECSRLHLVRFPENTHFYKDTLGDLTFLGCENLRRVNIPSTVTCIGYSTFRNCKKLSEINIPDSVTHIGAAAFFGCSSLNAITLPEGIRCIKRSLFQDCSNLEDFVLPDSVTTIEEAAFDGCSKLQYSRYDNGLYLGTKSNPYYALVGLVSRDISTLQLHKDIAVVAKRLLWRCSNLVTIIPEGKLPINDSDLHNLIYDCVIIAPHLPMEHFRKAKLQAPGARGYLHNRAQYTDPKIVAAWKKYLSSQKLNLLPRLIRTDDIEAIMVFAQDGIITGENVDSVFLQPAMAAGAKNCVAFLLDWKNKNGFATKKWKL